MSGQHYEAPDSLKALLELLAADPNAMILAGGHSLLPALATRGQRSGRLVDIRRLAALGTISLDEAGAIIGAGVTLSALLASPVATAYPALARAASFVGNHVVRNRSTMGGCLGWSDPRGEIPMILIAHDAVIRTSRRDIAAHAFLEGPFRNVLQSGEVILDARLPRAPRIAFDEIMSRNSTGRAIASAACAVEDGQVRLTLGGLADRPVRSDWLSCADERAFLTVSRRFVDELLAHYPALPDTSSVDYRSKIGPRLLHRCYLRAMTT